MLLGAGHRLLAEASETGDGGIGGVEVAVDVGLQVPHELRLDGEEGADHDRQQQPSL